MQFVENQTAFVIIVAHPRTGSSIVGELFNNNRKAFYVYEPVDAVYAAMYGVRDSWPVPTDIVSFWNGSQRFFSI